MTGKSRQCSEKASSRKMPETKTGKDDQRQQPRRHVNRPVAVERRPDADGDADHDPDHHRGERQVDGMRQHGADLGEDGPAGDHAVAEVAAQRIGDEGDVLQPECAIEPEPGAQRRRRLRRRLVAEDDQGRVARDDADDDEDQRQHRQKRRDRCQQPADDEAEHATSAGSSR
jgi:hypothetical protein